MGQEAIAELDEILGTRGKIAVAEYRSQQIRMGIP
jgi:hypothetical protein